MIEVLLLLLALLSSPAAAGEEGAPAWRLLYEDGTVLAAPAPGAGTGEAAAPVAVWAWSERRAPRRVERFGEALGAEDAGRLEVRVARARPAREGEPAAPLRLVAAPAAMWDLFPERWLPSWPVPESGRLALPHRKGERWRLRLVGEAEGSWWVDLHAGRARVELAAARASGLALLLTDPEGQPVEGAKVDLFRFSATGASATSFWAGDRSERGRVRWTGLPDREALFVRVSPGGELAPATATGLPSELPATLRLAPGARVVGRVVDEEGRPLPGARVSLETWLAEGYGSRSSATTGEDGRWKISGLLPGRAALVLRADGRADDARQVELRAGGNDLGTDVLARGAALVVRLVGDDGLPVAGGRSGPAASPRRGAVPTVAPAWRGCRWRRSICGGRRSAISRGGRASTRPSRRRSSSCSRGLSPSRGGSWTSRGCRSPAPGRTSTTGPGGAGSRSRRTGGSSSTCAPEPRRTSRPGRRGR
ncbi:MAG: carboxypeptidase-like regulatory domain-containing protein [Thermoanaerobaculia bacterium]|nr:carboxypeptidase-like regulatory domain-containing protein [Thermoanaerobaculia bacterium]